MINNQTKKLLIVLLPKWIALFILLAVIIGIIDG
jgi:hypothetical protein